MPPLTGVRWVSLSARRVEDRAFELAARHHLVAEAVVVVLVLLALEARLALLPFVSGDMAAALQPWYDFIVQHGRIDALREVFADYSPPYLYLLSAVTLLPLDKVAAIKVPSVVFDFVLAAAVFGVVRVKYSNLLAGTAALVTLYAPTVLFNSALWGQCDSIFTSFVILSLLLLLKGRNNWAIIAFALALSIKLPAVLFLPVFVILWLRRRISTLSLLLIPVTVGIAWSPSMVLGHSIADLLDVYANQTRLYPVLTMGAPNLYQWMDNNYFNELYPMGVMLTFALFSALAFAVYNSRVPISQGVLVKLSLLTVLLAAFFLPKMHERYFYLADIMSIIYAFYHPNRFYVPIVVILVSFFSYLPYLFGETVIDLSVLALAMAGIIGLVLVDFLRSLYPGDQAPEAADPQPA